MIFLAWAAPLVGELPFLEVPVQNPTAWDKKEVRMRGFLYRDAQGNVVLAREPNLKSCCVAAPHKLSEQVFVQGALPEKLPKNAVTLIGRFEKEEEKFILTGASVLPQSNSLVLASLVGAFFLLIGWFIFKPAKRSRTVGESKNIYKNG